jgi:drug/metabolite transporter (DMT)-like permease
MLAVMMQGGIAVFVVFAAIFLHERASLREWTGIVGVLVAMLLLVTSINGQDSSTHPSLSAVRLLSAMAIIAASLPFLNARLRKQGLAAAFASGIAFGLGSLYAKIITLLIIEAKTTLAFALLANPWLYFTIAANIVGLVLLQNSFHRARGIIAMPISSACSNLIPIIGGVVAFGETLPVEKFFATLRITAYVLTIISSGLLTTGD